MIKLTITNEDLFKIKTTLLERKRMIISTFKEETMYDTNDIEYLWADLLNFIDNFLILWEKTKEKWYKESSFYQVWEPHSEYRRIPWGKVLLCSPGNAPIPIIPIILLSFGAVGNEIVLCPSRKTSKTAKLLYETIESIIGYKCHMTLYEGGCQKALQEFVESGKVKLLYFQGGSKFKGEIYKIAYSRGVDVIFEGEGNVVTILGDDFTEETLKSTVEKIFEAKKFCGGQMCTAPNTIFLHKNISTRFINQFVGLSENSELIQSLRTEQMKWIKSLINDGVNKNYIADIYPPNYISNLGVRPTLIKLSSLIHVKDYLNKELFSPFAFLTEYDKIEDVARILESNWMYGLQISLFSYNKNILNNILSSVTFARVTLNMNPVYQNSLLPWGGYKLSGYSYVTNFLEKATKPIIMEGFGGDEQ